MNKPIDTANGYLSGQILIAMPSMADARFEKSVIYMCAHSNEGAMGLIINRQAPDVSFTELVEQLDLQEVPDEALAKNVPIQIGGPVESRRGFVLHSSDFFIEDDTLEIEDDVSLTATIDILKAIAKGQGPERALLALGYAGWAPGQLENEIQSNGWLSCDPDENLIFFAGLDEKYELALGKLGIDPSFLVSEAGHA